MIAQIKMRRGTTAEWAAASPVVLAAGEPGWDSSLKGMKVGDGSTEWAALPWIDAKNRPDINADTLDGVHLADIRLGQNILHNADFRNPVNQRGVGGLFSTVGGHFIDRWKLAAVNCSVNPGHITTSAGTFLEHWIEGVGIAGKTLTFSVMLLDGTIYTIPVIPPTTPDTYGTAGQISGFGAVSIYRSTTGHMRLKFSTDAGESIVAAKLELGTVSTIHLDPPMDHAVELLKCQRYYEKLGTGMYFMAYSATGVIASSPFAVYKRIAPSSSLLIGTMIITDALSNYTATTLTLTAYGGDNKGVRQALLSGFTGLTVGKIYYCANYYDGIIGVSADL